MRERDVFVTGARNETGLTDKIRISQDKEKAEISFSYLDGESISIPDKRQDKKINNVKNIQNSISVGPVEIVGAQGNFAIRLADSQLGYVASIPKSS